MNTLDKKVRLSRRPKRMARDKRRVEIAENSDKRYECCAFPAYYGSPIMTNSYAWAVIISFLRSFLYMEATITDHKTGERV